MKIFGTNLSSTTRNFGVLAAFGVIAFSGCTPEGVINKTKYKGEKIVNTCDAFKEEVASLVNANNNSAQLVVAEYDNSEFDYYYLEPGQYEIKDGMLNWRFAGDIEYDKYLVKGVAITAMATYDAMDHLKGMENPTSGNIGSLRIDRAYYNAHKEPVFMYQMPIEGNAADLNGKQIKISFKVEKFNKKGKLKKVFCKTDETPLGPVGPACCTFQPWDKANPQSVIVMPDVKIDDEQYKYRGFTGTLDLIFPENSVVFDKKVLTSAIQDYIKKYSDAGYKATNINLDGWASLGGEEARNQDLSERRAKAVFEDLTASLADASIQIAYAGKGEDWERLKLLTKASGLSGEEQAAVLGVCNGAGSNDEKEAAMRKLSFWTKLVDEVIVNTRHTFVTFKFDYQPNKMYVDYYPSQMPISSELLKVANETMVIGSYQEGGDTKKGLRTLDILLGNNKKANLYAMRSTYHFGNNDFQSAIGDIDEAIGLDRNNTQYALAGLAYKTRYAGNYTIEQRLEMMDQYNDYVVRYPDNKSLYYNRAVMMDKIGYISGALAEYDELLQGGETSAASLNNRGVAKLKTMRTTEAEADFRAALDKDKNLAEAYFNLSLIYAYRGLTEKCVAELGKAVARDLTFKSQIWSNPAFAVLKDNPKFDVFR
jgi:tetratricopeptide (TPR) repeat protein